MVHRRRRGTTTGDNTAFKTLPWTVNDSSGLDGEGEFHRNVAVVGGSVFTPDLYYALPDGTNPDLVPYMESSVEGETFTDVVNGDRLWLKIEWSEEPSFVPVEEPTTFDAEHRLRFIDDTDLPVNEFTVPFYESTTGPPLIHGALPDDPPIAGGPPLHTHILPNAEQTIVLVDESGSSKAGVSLRTNDVQYVGYEWILDSVLHFDSRTETFIKIAEFEVDSVTSLFTIKQRVVACPFFFHPYMMCWGTGTED